jgi:hypothetical protein
MEGKPNQRPPQTCSPHSAPFRDYPARAAAADTSCSTPAIPAIPTVTTSRPKHWRSAASVPRWPAAAQVRGAASQAPTVGRRRRSGGQPMNAPEEWRWIPGYEGAYQVSNTGHVRSACRVVVRSNGRPMRVRERILRPWRHCRGVESVALLHRGHYQIVPSPSSLHRCSGSDHGRTQSAACATRSPAPACDHPPIQQTSIGGRDHGRTPIKIRVE